MNRVKKAIERLSILNAWVTSGIVVLNLLVGFVIVNIESFESLTLVVVMTGTVGGAASNYRRLQNAYTQQSSKSNAEGTTTTTDTAPPIVQGVEDLDYANPTIPASELIPQSKKTDVVESSTFLSTENGSLVLLRLQIFLSPLFGGLFAFVLYGVFASGIIQGEIFPTFQSTEKEYTKPYTFVDELVPATNGDASKLILWSFIAGFAEGFVPNFIDKLVNDVNQDDE